MSTSSVSCSALPLVVARTDLNSLVAVVLLNINGFYSSLREFINQCVGSASFLQPATLIRVVSAHLPSASSPASPPSYSRLKRSAISSGFISESNRNFLSASLAFPLATDSLLTPVPTVFVDQPESGDWGEAALQAIDVWKAKGAGGAVPYSFEWSEDRKKGREVL